MDFSASRFIKGLMVFRCSPVMQRNWSSHRAATGSHVTRLIYSSLIGFPNLKTQRWIASKTKLSLSVVLHADSGRPLQLALRKKKDPSRYVLGTKRDWP